mgnify:CR=1 FL=1
MEYDGLGRLVAEVDAGSFAVVIAYVLVAISFLLLRRNQPDMARPFRLPHGVAIGWLALAQSGSQLLADGLGDLIVGQRLFLSRRIVDGRRLVYFAANIGQLLAQRRQLVVANFNQRLLVRDIGSFELGDAVLVALPFAVRIDDVVVGLDAAEFVDEIAGRVWRSD